MFLRLYYLSSIVYGISVLVVYAHSADRQPHWRQFVIVGSAIWALFGVVGLVIGHSREEREIRNDVERISESVERIHSSTFRSTATSSRVDDPETIQAPGRTYDPTSPPPPAYPPPPEDPVVLITG